MPARGHSKDHGTDLKLLLFILTVTGDGTVPVALGISIQSADSRPLPSNRVLHSCGDNTCGIPGIRFVNFTMKFAVESDLGRSW